MQNSEYFSMMTKDSIIKQYLFHFKKVTTK